MLKSRRALIGACAIAALAALPAASSAAGQVQPTSYRALYDISFSGSQSTVWHYSHAKNQSDPCDAGSKGDGSQMIRFYGAKTYRAVISQPTPRNPFYQALGPRPLIFSEQPMLAKATAEREGSYKVSYDQIDTAHCQASGSDGGDTIVPLSDCGKRSGTFTLQLAYANRMLSPVGGPPSWPEKDWLKAEGTNPNYGKRLGQGLEETYRNCPFEIGASRDDRMGAPALGAHHLLEHRLFTGHTILVHLSKIYPYNLGDASGTTIVTYNIRLRPVP